MIIYAGNVISICEKKNFRASNNINKYWNLDFQFMRKSAEMKTIATIK